MKKILFILLIVLISVPVFAGFQFDIDVNVPYYMGVTFHDQEMGDAMEYAFIIPDAKLTYYMGFKLLKVGVGLKAYTAIIQSFVYPTLNVESKVGPLVLNANLGGYVYGLFGLTNSVETGELLFGEATVAYKFGLLSLGTGVIMISSPELLDDKAAAFAGTVFLRFTL